MGRTLADLRAALAPGELQLYRVLAEVDGPWWGERADLLAAAVRHSVFAAAVGDKAPAFEQLVPKWGGAPPVELLPWADAANILRAAAGRKVVPDGHSVDR